MAVLAELQRACITLTLLAQFASAFVDVQGASVAGWTSHHGCLDHPQAGVALDEDVTFSVATEGEGRRGALCAGSTYSFDVAFPAPRAFLLTTSAGSFVGDTDASCPDRLHSAVAASEVHGHLHIPCDAAGSIQLIVTTYDGLITYQNSATLQVDPACSICGRSVSSTASARRALQDAGGHDDGDDDGDGDDDDHGPAVATSPIPAPSGTLTPDRLNQATGCSATPNAYGYLCTRTGLRGVSGAQVMYTVSTSSTPPNNTCTRGVRGSSLSLPSGGDVWLHVMLLSNSISGWLGLAWADPNTPTKMDNGKAIVASQSGDAMSVHTYTLTGSSLGAQDAAGSSWANQASAFTTSGVQGLCFTVAASLGSAAPTIGRRRLSSLSTTGVLQLLEAWQLLLAQGPVVNGVPQRHTTNSPATLNTLEGIPGSSPAHSSPGAPQVGATGPTPTSSPAPSSAAMLTADGLNTATGCSAAPATYKYACNRKITTPQLKSNWQLSYTVSTSASPPDNVCTHASLAAAAAHQLPAGATHWVHFMVSSTASGWISMAFPEKVNVMDPAKAIMGYADATGGHVNTFTLTTSAAPKGPDATSWAFNMGAASDAGRTLICWSQPAVLGPTPGVTTGVAILDLSQGLGVNFASATKDDFVTRHDVDWGGVVLDIAAGTSSTPSPTPDSESSPAPSGGSSSSSSSSSSAATSAAAGSLTPDGLNGAVGCKDLPSLNGYACVRDMKTSRGSWQLSYTVSTSPVPPDNDCTHSSVAEAAAKQLPSGTNVWVHFMVSALNPGWVALAFVGKAGSMVPGDAVLGGMGTSGQYVNSYSLQSYSLPSPNDAATSWAQNMGAMSTSDGRTAICFSRAAYLPGYTGSSSARRRLAQANGATLDLSKDLQMSVASNKQDTASSEHDFTAAYSLNMATGAASSNSPQLEYWVRAHGALMVAAFIFAMPTAILFARHKTLVPKVMVVQKAIWFWLHMGLQVCAVACFVAGIAIAWTQFPEDNIPSAANTLEAHSVIGVVVLVVVGIQVTIGFVRPDPSHKKRWMWNLLHHNWGRMAVLLAWANVATGIYLWNELFGTEDNRPGIWRSWTIAVCVIVGVLLLVELAAQLGTWQATRAERHAAAWPDRPSAGSNRGTGTSHDALRTSHSNRTSGPGADLQYNPAYKDGALRWMQGNGQMPVDVEAPRS